MVKHLYDEFARRWYRDGGCIRFYSDPHFNDEEMKYLRPNYVGDYTQVKLINSVVSSQDTIIFLGDIGDTSFIKDIKGYKVLVKGNHDKGALNYIRRNELKVTEAGTKYFEDNKLFDEVYEGPLFISERILLTHEPVECHFALNIHGHSHGAPLHIDEFHLNVCAENLNYKPICLGDIIKSGRLKLIESLHRITIDNAGERNNDGENSFF